MSPSTLDDTDSQRLAEAFRLASSVSGIVWPGWESCRFPVLLVTLDREFLVGAPQPPEGFADAGFDPILNQQIWWRPQEFPHEVAAAFPVFNEQPIVVIGRAEATKKSSTSWVLTAMHEHFHQFQISAPGYFAGVTALDLAGDDRTAGWMLDYPFPYESTDVVKAFSDLSTQLGRVLNDVSARAVREFWLDFATFVDQLDARDARYLQFQVWQEGVARYVELRVAEVAAQTYTPSGGFLALGDTTPFARLAKEMRQTIFADLAASDLKVRRRESFYPFGAGLALLLDHERASDWKTGYLSGRFALAG